MSTVLVLADARARGIALPADDTIAQAVLDETEAWLERMLGGPLVGTRTETFYVTVSGRAGKLSLQRYTDAVSIEDNGDAVDNDHFRLIDKGSAIARTYSAAAWWWTGPYVAVTYEPNDLLELSSVAYQILSMSATPEQAAGQYQSETIGSYTYAKAGGAQSPQGSLGARRSLARSILPKRDGLVNVVPTHLDYPSPRDASGFLNAPEPRV